MTLPFPVRRRVNVATWGPRPARGRRRVHRYWKAAGNRLAWAAAITGTAHCCCAALMSPARIKQSAQATHTCAHTLDSHQPAAKGPFESRFVGVDVLHTC